MNFIAVSAASLAIVVVVHTTTFLIGRRIGRYNIVDVAWGVGFVAVAAVAAVVGTGDLFRRILLLVLVAVWGLRLAWHMIVKSAGKGEDPRYQDLLRGDFSAGHVIRKIFLIQGAATWFVSLPLQLSAVLGPTPPILRPVLIAGVAVWALGLLFEAVGDHQLRQFKADPANKGVSRSKQRTFREIATHNSRQGSVPAMLGSLLVLGLLFTVHPLRLAIIVLLVSRPRPMQNLLSYWAGCLMVCLVTLLVPIIVVYFTPSLASLINDFADPAANPSARYFAIGLGVFALSIAALMAVRFAARPAADRPTSGGKHRLKKGRSVQTSTLVLEPDSPYPIARLLAPSQDEMVEDESLFRRLLRRVRNAWENGSLWVAFVIGLFMGPSVDGALFILAMIVASGATIAMQVSAAITFTLAMLAVEEIIFLSNLATPAKTQSFLRWLHAWTRAHHRKALVAIFAVVGLSLIAHGVTGG